MTHTHRLAALALATCLLAACDARVPQPTPTAEVAAAAVTTITPATTSEPTTASQPSPTLAPASGNGLSIYNESIPKVPAKRILIAELDLMLDALRLLDAKKWNGSIDQPLPLSESEFDPAKLRAYIADADADQVVMTMPPDIEPVYLSTDSVQEIRAVLFSAHSEYIDFLKHQGVPQKYIDEMLNVLPADATRIVYHPINKADVPPSAVDGLSTSADNPKDYSRYQLDVYTVDLYNIATDLEPSLILDAVPTSAEAKQQRLKQWRDMAIRKLVYHEMTHVLQRAYINLHVSDANYRTSESAYLWATQSLAPASAADHWQWGGVSTVADGNNQHLSNESQADGIGFQVLAQTYNMSQAQRAAAWDHLFGRLDNASATLDAIRKICESRFPALVPDSFGSPLAGALNQYTLKKLAFRLVNLSAYIGYLHPLPPNRTDAFWNAVRD